MKQFLLLVALLFATAFPLSAQTFYDVIAKDYAEAHVAPDLKSEVAGRFYEGDVLSTFPADNGFVTTFLDGQSVYVSLHDLELNCTEEGAPDPVLRKIRQGKMRLLGELYWHAKQAAKPLSDTDTSWAIVFIIPLMILMIVAMKMTMRKVTRLRFFMWMFLLAALVFMELIFLFGVQDPLWFFREVVWWACVLNFVIFALIVVGQAFACYGFMDLTSQHNVRIGLGAWCIGFVLGGLVDLFGYDASWCLLLVAVGQVVQAAITFWSLRHEGLFTALFAAVTLVVLSLLTGFMLFFLVLMVMMIVTVVLIIHAVLNALNYYMPYTPAETTPADQSLAQKSKEEYYETPDGSRMHYEGFGTWHDDRGRHYENTGAWGGPSVRCTDDD